MAAITKLPYERTVLQIISYRKYSGLRSESKGALFDSSH